MIKKKIVTTAWTLWQKDVSLRSAQSETGVEPWKGVSVFSLCFIM